jgi:chromosome transmission fidelity protein 8
MPQVTLYPPPRDRSSQVFNPLPRLLQTPSGLAILELQGTINLPSPPEASGLQSTSVGRLEFPDYHPQIPSGDKTWMKKIYLYVGKHQRLTGEIKKLSKPLGLVRRKTQDVANELRGQKDGLEMVEVVEWEIVFSSRPEPVGEMDQ